MTVVDHEVGELEDDIEGHSHQLRTLEEELQTLSETGSLIGMQTYI